MIVYLRKIYCKILIYPGRNPVPEGIMLHLKILCTKVVYIYCFPCRINDPVFFYPGSVIEVRFSDIIVGCVAFRHHFDYPVRGSFTPSLSQLIFIANNADIRSHYGIFIGEQLGVKIIENLAGVFPCNALYSMPP